MERIHHFTVDVEEYFHPTTLHHVYPPDRWEGLERRTPATVPRILEFLADRGIQGTFFVLGWLAEREPWLVREIGGADHEIASHGWEHRAVHTLEPSQFRDSVRHTKRLLEDLSGQRIAGYRAPSFSIVPGTEWALGILAEEGYEYDSSICPTPVHPTYGYPGAERDPHHLTGPGEGLVEVPPSTLRMVGLDVPMGGGAYFRILPYSLVRAAFRQAEDRDAPGTFFIHPWELDDRPPDLPASWLLRARIRGGTRSAWSRLERLVEDFRFGRMDETVRALRGTSRLEAEGR